MQNVPIAPAVFSDRILANGQQCQIAGWNVVAANTPSNLNIFNGIIMDRDLCNSHVAHVGRIQSSMFCVVDNPIATAGVCQVNFCDIKIKANLMK